MVVKAHKYSNGGPVPPKKPPKVPPKKPTTNPANPWTKSKRHEEELGLRDGGKVKRKC